MQIEHFTLEDLPGLPPLQPHDWPDITPQVRQYVESEYCYPIKVTSDGELAGIGASIFFGETCWLAHIIVGKAFRNKGIGGAIVQALIDEGVRRNVRSQLLIATELGFPVYRRAGFRPEGGYIFMCRPTGEQPLPELPHIVQYNASYREEILAMDRLATGEDRSWFFLGHLEKCLVYVLNGEVHGFFLPGLGDGLLLAQNNEAGRALLEYKCSMQHQCALPMSNQAGIHFLENAGFADTQFQGTRMILGDKVAWTPTMIYSRMGGNVG